MTTEIENNIVDLKSIRKVRTEILSQFKGLVFNDRFHSYRFQQDDLANVSTFVNKLTPPFDPEMATRTARSKGAKGLPSNPDYYTQRWAFLRDEASNRGSRVHLFAEQYPILDEPVDNLEHGVCNFYDYMEDMGYEVVLMELRMTDGQLAGTCDLLLRHKVTGKYVIADWKTNAKDITEVKHYHKPLEILSTVIGNDIGKYACQLNMYKYLLENKGIEIDALWVIHLNDMYDNLFKVIEVDTLDIKGNLQEGQELSNLLLDFKQELAEKKAIRESRWKKR